MKKQLNIALLPAAVAAALLSGNVMAGTESCFENWNENAFSNAPASGASYAKSVYSLANCSSTIPSQASGGVASNVADFEANLASGATNMLIGANATTGIPTTTAAFTIAREVSKSYTTSGKVGGNDINITYIPTTDIPGGSYITMDISNATFGEGNSDQIFLLAHIEDKWETLATTDGAINNKQTMKFVSQSGTAISAGTRMILSREKSYPVPATFEVANTDCSLQTKDIVLTVSDVQTSGNQPILGGIGATAILATIAPQYTYKMTSASDLVDAALQTNSRETFEGTTDLYTSVASFMIKDNSNGSWIQADDDDVEVLWATESTGDAGSNVMYGVEGIQLDGKNNLVSLDNTEYKVPGSHFIDASKELKVVNVANDDGTYSPMNFNYDVITTAKITFTDTDNGDGADYLAGCSIPQTSHNIGVNGAVLKVPYMRMTGKDQFVKITNESNKDAAILLDVFNDAASDDEVVGVTLGDIASKETRLFYGQDLMAAAAAAGYTATGETNHTATFVVTAPDSQVHGVSTQKVPGQSDRVQPVLRSTKELKGFGLNASGAINSITTEQAAWKW